MLVLVGLLALVAHEVVPGRRVAALEAAMVDRDAADPLMGVECRLSTPVRGEIAGQVRDKPCIVTFQRLLDAPQQFQGRRVEGQGRHESGLEVSALHPLDLQRPDGWKSMEHALWVGTQPFARPDEQHRVVVVGRFRRGPAGRLAAYFASLDDQQRDGAVRGERRAPAPRRLFSFMMSAHLRETA